MKLTKQQYEKKIVNCEKMLEKVLSILEQKQDDRESKDQENKSEKKGGK